jgi:hypothetical protein
MPEYTVPSPEELGGGELADRKPLPGNEDYRARIIEIKEAVKPNFEGKPINVFTIKFDILSYADNEPLTDIDGTPVESRWSWKDVDPTRMGFKKDGTASIARQFFLAANGISDLQSRVPNSNTDDLIGKEVNVSLIVYVGKDGKQRNRIVTIKALGSRRRPVGVLPTTQEPVRVETQQVDANSEYMKKVNEIFADDAAKASGPVENLPF